MRVTYLEKLWVQVTVDDSNAEKIIEKVNNKENIYDILNEIEEDAQYEYLFETSEVFSDKIVIVDSKGNILLEKQ